MEGTLKLLTLAMWIAIAWTLLSLLSVAFWALLLEVRRRFGSTPTSKPSAREETQLSAEVRAIYADFADVNRACSDAPAPTDPDGTGQSEAIVFIGWTSVQKR